MSFYSETYSDMASLQTRLAAAETDPKAAMSIDGWFNELQEVIRNTEDEQQKGDEEEASQDNVPDSFCGRVDEACPVVDRIDLHSLRQQA